MYLKKFQNVSQANNIIEIIGMPAVGKSTYTEDIIAKSNGKIIDINGQLPKSHFQRQIVKFRAVLLMFLREPRKFYRDFRIIFNSEQLTFKDFLFSVTNWYLVIWQSDQICKNGQYGIFDQGVLQAVWSIALRAKKMDSLCDLLEDNSYMPYEVVFLDENDEILIEREKRREKKIRLDYSDPQQLLAARRSLELVINYLGSNYK